MTIERVLIVDDEPLMRNFIAETLKRLGKEVATASNGQEAIQRLNQESFDLVVTDRKMPIQDGLEVLKTAKSLHPACFVIMMTAFGSVESTVEAMRLGAFNYLIKPFPPEALEAAVEQCEAQSHLLKENRYLREAIGLPQIVSQSAPMKRVMQDLDKIAKSQASVFITGESGTGKEVIASAIHQLSPRSPFSFVKVNCAAIPETLLESEFFGHEKGAFTGAHVRKTGRFELADKGTILLDEVTEIPLSLQPKLLRAIQEQEFERVGGLRSIRVNIRILATSNRNMNEAIETKVFREDLFYRLNVVPIHLPSLRQRTEDIIPLAHFFIDRFCTENHKTKKTLSERACQKLLAYHWPGNVRELANIIERTVVLDFGEQIDSEHLYLEPIAAEKPPETGLSLVGQTIHQVEKQLILDTLQAHHQNRTKTAAVLGISVRTLRNKLQEYGAENYKKAL
ncbi:MAG: putative sigma-54 dependent response regulator [Parachlamydiales bacterium]|nr:putative sigma-54 dependent response regulator [Parachlamydiales bacterium]